MPYAHWMWPPGLELHVWLTLISYCTPMWSKSPIEGLFQKVRIPGTGREMAHTHIGHAADSSSCWFVVFLLLSHVWLFATPWTAARQASLSFTIFWSLLQLMSIKSVSPSNDLVLCQLLLLLPSVFPSIGVFSKESAPRIRWPKYWSFSIMLIISPKSQKVDPCQIRQWNL